MSTRLRTFGGSTGYGAGLWPVLLALLIVVAPTACVLWFLNEAVRNERLAAKQRLVEAYGGQLPMLRDRLERWWQQQTDAIDAAAANSPGAAAFATCVRDGLADSVVVYDASGQLLHPAPAGERSSTSAPLLSEDGPVVRRAKDVDLGATTNLRSVPGLSSSAEDTGGQATRGTRQFHRVETSGAREIAEKSSTPSWSNATSLEYAQNDPVAAAIAYAQIAADAADGQTAALAIQAQSRCMARAGQAMEAVKKLLELSDQERFAQAKDADGRLIALDAKLRAIELLGDRERQESRHIADRLVRRLNDYDSSDVPASQRRFLMKEITQLTAGAVTFPTLPAEELAAAYVETHPPAEAQRRFVMQQLRRMMAGVVTFQPFNPEKLADEYAKESPPAADASLRPSGLPGVWHIASPSKRVVALLRNETLMTRMADLMAADALPPDVRIAMLPPETEPPGNMVRVSSAGERMPGWRLALSLDDESAAAGDNPQVAAYLWTAVLVIAAMSIIAVLVAGVLRRQMRLTRLKNDLLATVSHELKTPLASIRLLVDTLLDSQQLDVPKTREYLQLVAKENTRLSRLIDNFLSFSRMERNKHAFTPSELAPASIIAAAAEAVGERFSQADCRLEIDVEPDLPPILADADAMTTALVNLLDNAYKYTDGAKHISLRAHTDGSWVYFDVADNGIGLSRAACRRVFKRFYQVDKELSRSRGGCGLGLSIVEFIAHEHGGRASVRSQPGKGSTFTIAIPCCGRLNLERRIST